MSELDKPEIDKMIPLVNDSDKRLSDPVESLTPEDEAVLSVYEKSTLIKKRQTQIDRNEPFGACFSDIDDTFYRPDRAEASQSISKEADSLDYPVIAVTGNNFENIERRINSGKLSNFDAIVGSVGNEIWIRQSSEDEKEKPVYKKDEEYERLLILAGFDREKIAHEVIEMASQIQTTFTDSQFDYQSAFKDEEIKYLNGQEADVQPFKISFHFFASSNQEIDNIMGKITETFPNQKIVMCGEIGYNTTVEKGQPLKYCVDIVAATKVDAVNYLTNLIDVKRGIIAGDSGNDLDMLLKNKINMEGVVVGGYKPEVAGKIAETTVSKNQSGKFIKLKDDEGQIRRLYVEPDQGKFLGPESISRAARIFRRAIGIKNARERREKQ